MARTVLVTGATRGVGRALALQLQSTGCQVISVARSLDALPEGVEGLALDLAAPDAATRIASWVRAEHPRCAGLINNAAIMVHALLTEDPQPAEVAREIAINLVTPMQLSAQLLPVIAAQEGFVCNITSGLALAPKRDAAVYSASKSGLRAFSRALRDQVRLAALPVQVHEALLPLVDTSLSQGAPEGKMPPEEAARQILAGIRSGEDEIDVGKVRLLRLLLRLSPALAYGIIRRS
ncbi:3-oxoacyl-[acyl-carrier-protein] reductase FabG [Pseudooceanicola marinus]|uniref:3-oxoacyl-[acyl-carrier-protein] reductase FabG n=1 Tax=Pseudooceanicola marinus TaxID=396013 RepID=A0A1X6ZMJ1_9RHOB|nr:SDR family NAD(P)-dependent oxidoreductase [Pseudooceanicola marinus]PJE26614.1 short-chain dehydrogenase [Pseudooceanicola marinus]SLN55570.1 3-oxoacyl-[acyl-carrier-protein] reductase FabG [Pseudooceanicola marinus]